MTKLQSIFDEALKNVERLKDKLEKMTKELKDLEKERDDKEQELKDTKAELDRKLKQRDHVKELCSSGP